MTYESLKHVTKRALCLCMILWGMVNLHLSAQDCNLPKYRQAMSTADSLIAVGDYSAAYDQYNAAKVYCRERSSTIQHAQDSLFKRINILWTKAEFKVTIEKVNALVPNNQILAVQILRELGKSYEGKGLDIPASYYQILAKQFYRQFPGEDGIAEPMPSYQIFPLDDNFRDVQFHIFPDGNKFLIFLAEDQAQIRSFDGKLIHQLKLKLDADREILFSADSRYFLAYTRRDNAYSQEFTAKLFDAQGNMLKGFWLGRDLDHCEFTASMKQLILTGERKSIIWDIDRNFETEIEGNIAHLSPNQELIVAIDGSLALLDTNGKVMFRLESSHNDNKWGLTYWTSGEVKFKEFSSSTLNPDNIDFIDAYFTADPSKIAIKGKYDGRKSSDRFLFLFDLQAYEFELIPGLLLGDPHPEIGYLVNQGDTIKWYDWENRLLHLLPKEGVIGASLATNEKSVLHQREVENYTQFGLWAIERNQEYILGDYQECYFPQQGEYIFCNKGWLNDEIDIFDSQGQRIKTLDISSHYPQSFNGYLTFNGGLSFIKNSYSSTIINSSGQSLFQLNTKASNGDFGEITSDGRYAMFTSQVPQLNSSTSKREIVNIWDLSGTLIKDFKHPSQQVTSIQFDSASQTYLTISDDSLITIFSEQAEILSQFSPHEQIYQVEFLHGEDLIATLGDDQKLKIWDKRGKLIAEKFNYLSTYGAIADGFAYLSEGNSFALFIVGGTIIYSFERDELTEIPNMKATDFMSSSDGKHVVLVNADTLEVFKSNNWEKLTTIVETNLSSFRISASDDVILTQSKPTSHQAEVVKYWNLRGERIYDYQSKEKKEIPIDSIFIDFLVKNNKEDLPIEIPEIYKKAISPDGQLIYVFCYDGTIYLLSRSGKMISKLFFEGNGATFTPDGKGMVVYRGHYLDLYNLTGEKIAELKGHTAKINNFHFSDDGGFIFTCANDGTAKKWPLPRTIYEWLQSPDCPIPPLTQEERIKYNLLEED